MLCSPVVRLMAPRSIGLAACSIAPAPSARLHTPMIGPRSCRSHLPMAKLLVDALYKAQNRESIGEVKDR